MTHIAIAVRLTMIVCLAVVSTVSSPDPAMAAKDQTRPDLFTSPAEVVATEPMHDGRLVLFEGEAIGEDIRADGSHRWVNLLGEGVAVGVWMTAEDAAKMTTWGDYRHTGDLVRVSGTVNIACARHQGEFDVHADEVVIVMSGAPRTHDVRLWKALVGVALLALGYAEYRLYRRRREVG